MCDSMNNFSDGMYQVVYMDSHSVEHEIVVTRNPDSTIGSPLTEDQVFNVRKEKWQSLPISDFIIHIEQLTGPGAKCNEDKIFCENQNIPKSLLFNDI